MLNFLTNLFSTNVTLKIKKINPQAKLPTKAHMGVFEDAAFDLFCVNDPETVGALRLPKGSTTIVPTGIKAIIPPGYWIKLHERSGHASKRGLHIHGGVIDSGYTGQIHVIVYNSSNEDKFLVSGDAVCQFSLEKIIKTDIEDISDSEFEYEETLRTRKESGFGSTDSAGPQ